MKLNREDENFRMQDLISNFKISSPEIDRNIILMDISRSLSIIADVLSSKDETMKEKDKLNSIYGMINSKDENHEK